MPSPGPTLQSSLFGPVILERHRYKAPESVGTFHEIHGLTKAPQYNGQAAVLLQLGADADKVTVHVLRTGKELKLSPDRLRQLPLEQCVDALCAALARRQRAGAFEFNEYLRYIAEHYAHEGSDMTLAEQEMMAKLFAGEKPAPELKRKAPSTRRVKVPPPALVVCKDQYNDDGYAELRVPEGCNCIYMLLKYCAQAASPSSLLEMEWYKGGERRPARRGLPSLPSGEAVSQRIEAFVSGSGQMGAPRSQFT